MKTDKNNKGHKGSPIIMAPDKEKEVTKKDEETEERIADSSPEQFAELKEANLRMKREDQENEWMDEEQ